MKRLYKFIIFTFIILGGVKQATAQELSTLGKTFWLTFMQNNSTNSDGATPSELKVVVSCNKATSGTVRNFISGQSLPFSIGAGGGVDTVFVPGYMGYTTGSEGSSSRNMGLIVQANDTVAVSAQNSKQYTCDAALIYPIEALGIDYRIFSHLGDQNTGFFSQSNYRSSFAIVATENNTKVEITPSTQTTANAANTKYTITLQKGETYQVLAFTNKLDLSGTLVQALDCKKIAVFGGSTRSSVTPNGGCGGYSYDHLYEQMMPINLWGKKFIVAPTIYAKSKVRRFELFKVVASQNSTTVRFNGRLKILSTAGMVDTFWLDSSRAKNAIINSNRPVGICHYVASENCDGTSFGQGISNADPMMMWVPPIEQSLKRLSFSCEKAQTIDSFFLNVIVKTQYRSSFRIDGTFPSARWKLITKDTSYSYIQQHGLTLGQHNISSPFGFSAMLYAYGNKGSYGYNAGSSIKALSFFTIANGKLSSEFEPDSAYFNICQGATIPFDGGASTLPNSWKWVFSDTTKTYTTKSFSRVFNKPGIFTVKMIAIKNVNGVCNGNTTQEDTITSEIRVFAKPKINLMNDTTICRGNKFIIKSTTDGDTNFTFSPGTWLNCTKCQFPISKPLLDTTYAVVATTKGCQPSRDTFKVKVRDSIFLATSNDTTICRGTATTLKASSKGGLFSNHTITWDNGLGVGISKTVSPKVTTTYRAILTDGCTRNSSDSFYADTNYITITVLDSLKITMPNDTIVCEGNDVTLTPKIMGGKITNRILSWDNSLGTGFTKTINMLTTNTFKAVLSDGCTIPKDSGYVTITVRPSIKIDTVIYNNPVCKNSVFTAKVKASGGDTTVYQFYLYNATNVPLVLIDSAKNVTSKTFNLNIPDDSKFRIIMKQGCNSQQISKVFNVKIKTGLSVTSNLIVDTICTGQNYTMGYTGISADALPIKFVLKRKNGANFIAIDSTIQASNASFTLTPTTTLTDYLVIANDNCSRNDSATFRLMVRAPLVLAKIRDSILCRNQNIIYTANVTGGKSQSITYNWQDINFATFFGADKTVTLSPTTSMKVRLDVSDGCSKALVDSALIMVAPLVTNSVLATNIAGCEDYNTAFTLPTTQAQSPYNPAFTWLYSFNGNNSSINSVAGQTFPSIPANNLSSGIYNATVQMQMSNGVKCTPIYSQQIDVYKQAVANFDYMPKLVDVVDPDVTFDNKSTGSTIHYWHYDDTLAGIYEQIDDPIHRFKDTGAFTITLIATNVNGCADTISQTLIVKDIYRIFIPGAFSPNDDDFNKVWYPRLTSTQSAELMVFNRWGEKVFENKDGTAKWNGRYSNTTTDCPEGVYYYQLKIRDTRKKWYYYKGTLTLLR